VVVVIVAATDIIKTFYTCHMEMIFVYLMLDIIVYKYISIDTLDTCMSANECVEK
jgi:hypothetical protein